MSLSSDGSRIAIGGVYNDGNGNSAGHVRIFDLVGGVWTQVGSDIDGEAADDWSGDPVVLSPNGSRVAVGARYNDGANGTNSGHVRIFEIVGGVWTQVGGI